MKTKTPDRLSAILERITPEYLKSLEDTKGWKEAKECATSAIPIVLATNIMCFLSVKM